MTKFILFNDHVLYNFFKNQNEKKKKRIFVDCIVAIYSVNILPLQ